MDELLEKLAGLEHEQWMFWSKAVAMEVSPERRRRWRKCWVDYDELDEEIKEHDRKWARQVLAILKANVFVALNEFLLDMFMPLSDPPEAANGS